MTDLRSLTPEQMEQMCVEFGWPSYRARQMFAWLWQKGVSDIEAMTNLSKEARRQLAEGYVTGRLSPVRTMADDDGTVKFTLSFEDGVTVESVYLEEPERRTVCVSTQAGCALGCGFCATGRLGFTRNLAWHEIAAQVLTVRTWLSTSPRHQSPTPSSTLPLLTNVVFMGMGEPFLNYDAVIQAIKVINAETGLGIGARHITVSTCGIPEGIRAYAQFPLQTRLALSLNASDDATRTQLMPVNRKHPLSEVMAAVRDYVQAKGKRVTFEYVMVDGVNNRARDVEQLARLLKGIPCKVNLIPLNPFPGCSLEAPSPESVAAFERMLWPLVPAVTVRKSKGARILAGCGQLSGGN